MPDYRVNLSSPPFFTALLALLLVTDSPRLGDNAKFTTETFLSGGKPNAKDYYSEAFLLLFFSIGTASVLDPNGKHRHFKERRMDVTARKGFRKRLIHGHSASSVTRSARRYEGEGKTLKFFSHGKELDHL